MKSVFCVTRKGPFKTAAPAKTGKTKLIPYQIPKISSRAGMNSGRAAAAHAYALTPSGMSWFGAQGAFLMSSPSGVAPSQFGNQPM